MAPPDFVSHLARVGNAVGPFAVFLTVLTAAIGWIVGARAAGEETRKTEREKRASSREAHRGLLRARLLRVWGIIDEAVGVKPYQPDIVERFIAEAEEIYWRVDTFASFSESEQQEIRGLLDTARLDNMISRKMIDAREKDGADFREIVWDCFLSPLDSLSRVFADVFHDDNTAARIRLRYEETAELVELFKNRRV
jgi:hypothetical protein